MSWSLHPIGQRASHERQVLSLKQAPLGSSRRTCLWVASERSTKSHIRLLSCVLARRWSGVQVSGENLAVDVPGD